MRVLVPCVQELVPDSALSVVLVNGLAYLQHREALATTAETRVHRAVKVTGVVKNFKDVSLT